jgi:type IX secretion system PorP/SprF family membrane protein
MWKISLFFLLFIISVNVRGQVMPVTDQYVLNPILINPGYTGGREALNIALFYRRQWVGINGAPETLTFSADAPVSDNKVGLGFSIITNKIGVTREKSISTSYSYKVETGDVKISLGLRAGIFSTNTRWSDLIVLDPGDEQYLADSKAYIVPDFGFGTYLSYNHYFAGLSIPRLLGYKFNYDKNRYSLKVEPGKYNYILNTGYLIDIAPDIKFFPSVLLSASPSERMLMDFNAHFGFSEKIWTGITYRSNKSIAALFQLAITTKVKVAYSYYRDYNLLGRYNNGSHEIMLRFEFGYKADVANPLIF